MIYPDTRTPHARIHNDPRRPGRSMVAVWCFCGRFYTATPENLIRHSHAVTSPCPNCSDPGIGRGALTLEAAS